MISKFGILDFIPRDKDTEVEESFDYTKRLAQRADERGLYRYWVGEHHNTPSLLSSSPMLVLAHLAAVTQNIKLGSGGVMLDNLSSYQVAENFKVLQAMFPGRIEAGIGHSAPAEKDAQEKMTIRMTNPRPYAEALIELAELLNDDMSFGRPFGKLRAMPTLYHSSIPMHLLLTSRSHARLAGQKGWGIVFGLYLNPSLEECKETIRIYRESFRPSALCPEPNAIVAPFVVSSYNEKMIKALETSLNHWILTFRMNKRSVFQLLSAEDALDHPFSPEEQQIIASLEDTKVVGTPEQLAKRFQQLKHELNCDEFLAVNQLAGYAYRKELIDILAEISE